MSFTIPVLETERLILREFRDASDFEPYAEFYASERTDFMVARLTVRPPGARLPQ